MEISLVKAKTQGMSDGDLSPDNDGKTRASVARSVARMTQKCDAVAFVNDCRCQEDRLKALKTEARDNIEKRKAQEKSHLAICTFLASCRLASSF